MNTETRLKVEHRLVAILVEEPSLSLNDIFAVIDEMRSGSAARPAPQKPVAPAPPKAAVVKATTMKPKAPKKVDAPLLPDLRKARGRATYDAQVLAALVQLGGAGISSRSLAGTVAGTEEHRRNALKRLMAAGAVSASGQRSATKYSVVAAVAGEK
ncbi:MAG: hypothetical protein HYV07_12410 [Deltaproteobacteria bacterium]|nr:hypothetical protein [Deltaproteobacteria bacterium]